MFESTNDAHRLISDSSFYIMIVCILIDGMLLIRQTDFFIHIQFYTFYCFRSVYSFYIAIVFLELLSPKTVFFLVFSCFCLKWILCVCVRIICIVVQIYSNNKRLVLLFCIKLCKCQLTLF